jgi:hypothetical protein
MREDIHIPLKFNNNDMEEAKYITFQLMYNINTNSLMIFGFNNKIILNKEIHDIDSNKKNIILKEDIIYRNMHNGNLAYYNKEKDNLQCLYFRIQGKNKILNIPLQN